MSFIRSIKTTRAGIVLSAAALLLAPVEGEEAIELKTSSETIGSRIGTSINFPRVHLTDEVLPMVEEAGLKWVRGSVPWDRVEREKGVLEIPAEEMEWIEKVHEAGINVCMPLYYFNDHYGHDDWPAFCEAYARYCVFMVGELKDKVQVWEIWNEPSLFFRTRTDFGGSWNAREGAETPWLGKFMDMLIVAARAVREAHPEVIITVGDSYPVNHHILRILGDRGAADLFDGIVIHPYNRRLTPELAPYGGPQMDERDGQVIIDKDHTVASAIRRIRERMKEVGMKTTDIYVTEYGFPTHYNTREFVNAGYIGHSIETQAKYLARATVQQQALGVKLSTNYNFVDSEANHPNPERNFGLVFNRDLGYEKKPSWHVMRRLSSLLELPMQPWEPDWAVTVDPPGYINSSNWPYTPGFTTWDGAQIKALDKVLTYTFRNEESGEALLFAWNAVEPNYRSPLQTTITLETDDVAIRDGVDLMTGKAFEVTAETADGRTVIKDIVVPDYPVVLRMTLSPNSR